MMPASARSLTASRARTPTRSGIRGKRKPGKFFNRRMAAMIANSAMSSADKSGDVVVTGLGVVSPLASSTEAFYAALRSGQSALARDGALSRRLPKMSDFGDIGEPVLARVGEFGADKAIDAGRRRRMPRIGQFCVVAAQQ